MAQWSRIGLQSKGCRRCKLDPWVRKISLEKEMATHSSILAWRNPMDRGARWAIVRGVTKSWTRLSTAQGSQLPSTQLLFSCFSEWGSCCPKSCALSGHCPSQPGLPSPADRRRVLVVITEHAVLFIYVFTIQLDIVP